MAYHYSKWYGGERVMQSSRQQAIKGIKNYWARKENGNRPDVALIISEWSNELGKRWGFSYGPPNGNEKFPDVPYGL